MKKMLFGITLIILLSLTSCRANKYTLTMIKDKWSADDESFMSPKIKEKEYKKIMIIPPSGTTRGKFDKEINLFEREFLKRGITVISGAVTGRVVYETIGTDGETRMEGARSLSDAERALVMAKKTGADAILQIGNWEWKKNMKNRYFILDKRWRDKKFKEVSKNEWQQWTGPRWSFTSSCLYFLGRLIDVESGEVIASFKILDCLNWNIPNDYLATYTDHPDVRNLVTLIKQQPVWKNIDWDQAREDTVDRVITQIAEKLM